MESKNTHSDINTASGASMTSVRPAKYINAFRIGLFVLIVLSLGNEVGDLESKLPKNLNKWAITFIEAHQLDASRPLPKEYTPENLDYSDKQLASVASNTPSLEKELTPKVIPTSLKADKKGREELESASILISNSEQIGLPVSHPIDVNPKYACTAKTHYYTSNFQSPTSSNSLISREFDADLIQVNSKWYAYFNIGPQFTNGSISQPSNESYEKVSGINDLVASSGGQSTTENKQSFAGTVALGYRLSNTWDVVSGVKYSQWNGSQNAYYDSEVTKFQTIITSVASSNGDGTKSFSNQQESIAYKKYFSDTLQAEYRLTLIEVPLMVRYNRTKNQWNYFVNTGFSGVISSKYSAQYKSNEIGTGEVVERKNGLSAVNFILGAGVEYSVSKKAAVQFSPQFHHGMSVGKNSDFKSGLSSFGIFAGLKYELH